MSKSPKIFQIRWKVPLIDLKIDQMNTFKDSRTLHHPISHKN